MDAIEQFIKSNPDPRELKPALAVQMRQRGHSYREIRDTLQVSLGFITNCWRRYQAGGVEGLKLNYWGTQGYLKPEEKQEVLKWLSQKEFWLLEEVVNPIEDTYGVVYKSPQSYYSLLAEGGFSWKKAHPSHPKKDETQVEEKKLKLENYWYSGALK